MDMMTFLMRSPDLAKRADAKRFESCWTPGHLRKGTQLVSQGDEENRELIILEGSVASRIYSESGETVCVGLHVGPCVVTPAIARTRNGRSTVSIEAVTDSLVVQMESDTLTAEMLEYEPVRNWANGILREELNKKADKEWCLAALDGAGRLSWFRERFPGYEEIFNHSLIASFLGITPVTLSRLRNNTRDGETGAPV